MRTNKNQNQVHLIITGNPVVKKNSRPIYTSSKSNGRKSYFLGKSENLIAAERAACLELYNQFEGPPIDYRVNAYFSFFCKDRRKRDLSNLYEFAQDALQAARILEDDYLIASHDGSRIHYDPKNPRTEIRLSRYI